MRVWQASLSTEKLIETCLVADGNSRLSSVVAENTQGGGFWAIHGLVGAGQNRVFWIQNSYTGPVSGHASKVWSHYAGLHLSDLVTFSRRIPSMTSYCLTVSVDRASS